MTYAPPHQTPPYNEQCHVCFGMFYKDPCESPRHLQHHREFKKLLKAHRAQLLAMWQAMYGLEDVPVSMKPPAHYNTKPGGVVYIITPGYYQENHFVVDKRLRYARKVTVALNQRGDIAACGLLDLVENNHINYWKSYPEKWRQWSIWLSLYQQQYNTLAILNDPFGTSWLNDRFCRKAFKLAMRTKGTTIYEIAERPYLLKQLSWAQKAHYLDLIRQEAGRRPDTAFEELRLLPHRRLS